ncbi:zinc ribbon domain-containing protein [Arcobacter vandammei]|uniref:zinc ribbon domain-containing protein n=1 Tax=Arcobacter vandammei TaxID=2782243 RepID=UPI0018DFC8D9|nr:zinc ribbon domain-containing protein [Arcobacter vandammei]
MKNFIQKFYKNNFVYGTKEKLSKLTILFIIILNIIVFNIILEGLNFQTSFVNSPSNKYPYYCTNIIKSENISNFDTFTNLAYYQSYEDSTSNYKNEIQKNKDEVDLRCLDVDKFVNLVKNEYNKKEIKKEIQKLNNEIYKLEDELNYYRNNYNTILFEKIASQSDDKSLIENGVNSENIKQKYDDSLNKLESLKSQKDDIYKNFASISTIKELENFILKNKESYLEDERKAFRFYYYMIEIVKMLFLLPLVFAFFYIMKKYQKDEKYILYIIFKNLFFIALIPTLFTIFEIIYKFLPKVFLSKIIEFFYNLDIPFVVYYFLVIVFVVIFAIIIIKIQKRFKEQNELMKKNKISRIDSFNQNLCNSCGNRVSYLMMNFCPICQNKLTTKCNYCQKDTILGFNFCQYCGTSMENE